MKNRRVRPRKNLELRAYLMENDITMTEIANAIYVSNSTLSTWFATPLSEETKDEIMSAAKRILAKRDLGVNDYEKVERADEERAN